MYKYLLLFITSCAFAQVPFSNENSSNTIAIKGCAYINLLDGGYGSIFGLERGFLKKQSIGAKFIYNHFTPHRENTADGSYNSIDYTKDIDKSLILEYKYYFNFKDFRERTGISFYSSLSYKTGINTIENDRNYPHDFYFQKVKYNYFGPALGATFVVSDSGKWTIDTQFGYLFGKKSQYRLCSSK